MMKFKTAILKSGMELVKLGTEGKNGGNVEFRILPEKKSCQLIACNGEVLAGTFIRMEDASEEMQFIMDYKTVCDVLASFQQCKVDEVEFTVDTNVRISSGKNRITRPLVSSMPRLADKLDEDGKPIQPVKEAGVVFDTKSLLAEIQRAGLFGDENKNTGEHCVYLKLLREGDSVSYRVGSSNGMLLAATTGLAKAAEFEGESYTMALYLAYMKGILPILSKMAEDETSPANSLVKVSAMENQYRIQVGMTMVVLPKMKISQDQMLIDRLLVVLDKTVSSLTNSFVVDGKQFQNALSLLKTAIPGKEATLADGKFAVQFQDNQLICTLCNQRGEACVAVSAADGTIGEIAPQFAIDNVRRILGGVGDVTLSVTQNIGYFRTDTTQYIVLGIVSTQK